MTMAVEMCYVQGMVEIKCELNMCAFAKFSFYAHLMRRRAVTG